MLMSGISFRVFIGRLRHIQKGKLMNKSAVVALMLWAMCAGAEGEMYDPNSTFNDAIKAEFIGEVGNDGETISGALINKNGKKFSFPDC